MVRSLKTSYESAISKLGFDRDLSNFLEKKTSNAIRDTAWRLARCADDHNLWFVNAPESGWLHGRFWKCRSKLCSFCLADESRRRRRKLRCALSEYAGSATAANWRFLTLTIENPHTSIHTTRTVVNQAWSKFRKRACFAVVEAGAKSEEFTLTKNGYHYHLHTLLHFSVAPNYQEWRKVWTECVEASGGSSTKLFGFDTIDGYLIANFKRVTSPENITNELCKYITKSTSFQKLSKAALLEMAETARWHRMFELIGKLRSVGEKPDSGTERASSIVHTKHLSDGWQQDRRYFEERRQSQRYFQIDHLENLFGTHVWSLTELQRAMISGQGEDKWQQETSNATPSPPAYSGGS